MKKYGIQQIGELASGNPKALFFAAFLFLVGVSSGVFLELSMTDADKMTAAQFLSRYLFSGALPDAAAVDYGNPFFSSSGVNLFLLALIMLSGLSAVGFPAAHLIVFCKGVALGFSSGLLLQNFAWKGAFSLLVSVLPQNLLLVPAFLAAAAAAQSYGMQALSARRAGRYQKNGRLETAELDRYFAVFLMLAGVVLLSCLIEAVLFPFLRG